MYVGKWIHPQQNVSKLGIPPVMLERRSKRQANVAVLIKALRLRQNAHPH